MPLEYVGELLTPSSVTEQNVVTIAKAFFEGTTGTYSTRLAGPGGALIANTQFTSMNLTLIDETTKSIINSRNQADVLGAGTGNGTDFTVAADATITWNIQAADTVLADPTNTENVATLRAILRFAYDIGAGSEVTEHHVRFFVKRKLVGTLPLA